MIRSTLSYAITAIVTLAILSQCRKPWGWLGRFMVSTMNRSHGSVTDWGLRRVAIEPAFAILDVGCGGGRTIQKLAAIAAMGRVSGVDYSAASVAAARRTNADAIAAGRVEIVQASVSRLPFPDAVFDLATAVETHYYWPDLVADLREVRRVLAPGGRVALIAESYRREGGFSAAAGFMRVLGGRLLTPAEHRDALTAAGFVNVAVDEEPSRSWICARGQSA